MTKYIVTFEAIGAVRGELARAELEGDSAKALDAYTRLLGLYASIDIKSVIGELAQADNVVQVDFKTKQRKAA